MGLFYNISGAQLIPFDPGLQAKPSIRPVRAAGAADAIGSSEGFQGPNEVSFQEALKRAGIQTYQEQLKNKKNNPKRVFRAQDIMQTQVQTAQLKTTLAELRSQSTVVSFQHWPVVDQDLHLVGMLSDRDILRHSGASEGEAQNLMAQDIMASQVLVATPETFIYFVAKAMLQEKIHALPVVNEEHLLLGILTTSDILFALVQKGPLELWV